MILRTIFLAGVIYFVPLPALAHGLTDDGHPGPLGIIDYIELGGVTLGSLGLLVYSFRQYRDKNKKQ